MTVTEREGLGLLEVEMDWERLRDSVGVRVGSDGDGVQDVLVDVRVGLRVREGECVRVGAGEAVALPVGLRERERDTMRVGECVTDAGEGVRERLGVRVNEAVGGVTEGVAVVAVAVHVRVKVGDAVGVAGCEGDGLREEEREGLGGDGVGEGGEIVGVDAVAVGLQVGGEGVPLRGLRLTVSTGVPVTVAVRECDRMVGVLEGERLGVRVTVSVGVGNDPDGDRERLELAVRLGVAVSDPVKVGETVAGVAVWLRLRLRLRLADAVDAEREGLRVEEGGERVAVTAALREGEGEWGDTVVVAELAEAEPVRAVGLGVRVRLPLGLGLEEGEGVAEPLAVSVQGRVTVSVGVGLEEGVQVHV